MLSYEIHVAKKCAPDNCDYSVSGLGTMTITDDTIAFVSPHNIMVDSAQLDVNSILIFAMTELPEQMHATRSVIEATRL